MNSPDTANRLTKENQRILEFVGDRKRCCRDMAYVDRTIE